MLTVVLVVVLPLCAAAVLIAALRRQARVPINPPYVSRGGTLPDFFNGHTWPVNTSRPRSENSND